MRDPRHDILFEPLDIGPVTAPNRFYQVPHCSGMGWRRPNTLAAMRGTKAEGGWGVVCTEYCSVHPASDDGGYPFATLWDEEDVRHHARMTDAVHAHGSLAGVELWLGGGFVSNLDSRLPTLGSGSHPLTNTDNFDPVQCRPADRQDIRNLLAWQGDAARRAVTAGFDIVYVYATHGYLVSDFLSPVMNTRSDEYGGTLENRLRIVRELIDVTRDAVAGKCAVACRFSLDLDDAESFDAFGMLADLPDLWDLTVPDYDIEMGVSRFVKEGSLSATVARARALTSRPVVAVGRFTSPDTMARVIRDGTQDLIGAARPSIADPFLPKKIEEGRTEDIRECIGCNICYAHNALGVPIRCTQNPTMGEEWRRDWHPEHIPVSGNRRRVLVIGSGPAGLEAARVLGEQGHEVMLAESRRHPGGRVSRECRLPGLAEWARVRDWRLGQIEKLDNVELYLESPMTVADIVDLGPDLVVTATGATWTTDAVGRHLKAPPSISASARVLSVDSVIDDDELPPGKVIIYDDDHYYMGSVLALKLASHGNDVTLVTPAGRAVQWGRYTEELFATNQALLGHGVRVITNRVLDTVDAGSLSVGCIFSGDTLTLEADWLLPVTRRIPQDGLFRELESAGVATVRVGDCDAPGTIAAAVYSGYRVAREYADEQPEPARREMPLLHDR